MRSAYGRLTVAPHDPKAVVTLFSRMGTLEEWNPSLTSAYYPSKLCSEHS